MRIVDQLLPYNDVLPVRSLTSLRMIVIHSTELPTLAKAREFGEKIIYDDQTGNSGHYYIDRDGALYRFVEDNRIARHVRGRNQNSIGIELVNTGRFPNWFDSNHQEPTEPFTDFQISCLRELLRDLKMRYAQLAEISRHSDLDTELIPADNDPSSRVRRKIDPGPLFPWEDIQSFWQSLVQ